MAKDKLSKSLVFNGFRKVLLVQFGAEAAAEIWQRANENLITLERRYPEISRDSKMLVLPSAALYGALVRFAPDQALPMLKDYGTQVGERIARIVHRITAVPGIPTLLWKNMPRLMRSMSSTKKGYTRRIVSETSQFVGVDILSCPLHDAAVKIGIPEAAQVVCAMDKAYMTGFRHIRYTRTTSVAEGDECCDYRLRFDRNKL